MRSEPPDETEPNEVAPPASPKVPAPRPPAGERLGQVEELELTVEKLVAGGDGLGRFEGIPVFVPRAAPGDRLRVRLTDRRRDYGRAEIVAILAPGPGRREPPCPHFARCGGCDLQHLDDALQTRLKAEALGETLQRLGGIKPPEAVRVRTGEPWGYRLRTQLHTAPGEGGPEVGYFARGSRELVSVDRCPVLVPELEAALAELPERLGESPPRRLDLAAGDGGEVTFSPVVEDLPHGEVRLDVGGVSYGYDARCFFQGHRGLLSALVEEAVGPWQGELAVDLYAGVGLFSLPLAGRYGRVVAVEAAGVAVRYARSNARRHRLKNLETVARAVESWLPSMPEGVDRVVLDPPRAGLSAPARRFLLERRPRRITYVSCHPATLARDLKALLEAYRLESLTALDLFPQTGHLEAVAQLVALD